MVCFFGVMAERYCWFDGGVECDINEFVPEYLIFVVDSTLFRFHFPFSSLFFIFEVQQHVVVLLVFVKCLFGGVFLLVDGVEAADMVETLGLHQPHGEQVCLVGLVVDRLLHKNYY